VRKRRLLGTRSIERARQKRVCAVGAEPANELLPQVIEHLLGARDGLRCIGRLLLVSQDPNVPGT
jgi:hypothetical protein